MFSLLGILFDRFSKYSISRSTCSISMLCKRCELLCFVNHCDKSEANFCLSSNGRIKQLWKFGKRRIFSVKVTPSLEFDFFFISIHQSRYSTSPSSDNAPMVHIECIESNDSESATCLKFSTHLSQSNPSLMYSALSPTDSLLLYMCNPFIVLALSIHLSISDCLLFKLVLIAKYETFESPSAIRSRSFHVCLLIRGSPPVSL